MCSRQQDRITQESAAELERFGKTAASEREDLVKKFDDERTQLVQQLANLQRDKDQAMLLAETEKQQLTGSSRRSSRSTRSSRPP